MKAYVGNWEGIPDTFPVIGSENAGKARYCIYMQLNDLGWEAKFQEIRIKRAKDFDENVKDFNKTGFLSTYIVDNELEKGKSLPIF